MDDLPIFDADLDGVDIYDSTPTPKVHSYYRRQHRSHQFIPRHKFSFSPGAANIFSKPLKIFLEYKGLTRRKV